jgi:hypothetical protein
MAEIDKSLPNEVRKEIEIEGPEVAAEENIEIQEDLPNAGETEITPLADGGVEINFEPGAFNQAQSENHYDNLAELLPEEILAPLGSELFNNYSDYKSSRQDWEQAYVKGLDLLGFKYEDRTEPFQGAAGATHPVLAEAVTQFQALAYKELLPAQGPVRTQIVGAVTPERESAVLLQLLGVVVGAGQRFAAIADMQVGDMNQQAAVGTTVALLERGSRVMSAVHKRLYVGLKQEFKLLAQVFKTYLPKEYPYDVVGGQRQIKLTDFDDRVDILPIADPNIFSQTQRISLAQTQLQLAQSNPQIHNLYQAYRSMYEAVGVKNINAILPPPQQPMPKDPSLEHIDALAARPFQAFPGQDHRAHIEAHLNFMQLNMVRNAPMVMGSIQKNILEHISIMAQEQVQLEFVREFGQLQVLQPQAQANPAVGQVIQQITQKIEARKAQLIAEMTQEFAMDENKITSQMDGDPLLKLKSREVDLRAMENERKKVNDEERINLDKMKAMMNQANQEEKLEQNEDLAKLRAFILLILSSPLFLLAYSVFAEDEEIGQKLDLYFEKLQTMPWWIISLWVAVVGAVYGIKATELKHLGGKK